MAVVTGRVGPLGHPSVHCPTGCWRPGLGNAATHVCNDSTMMKAVMMMMIMMMMMMVMMMMVMMMMMMVMKLWLLRCL